MPVSTSGVQALALAARFDEPLLAKRLMDIEVSGPEALVELLRSGHLEAASRLLSWGVDMTEALLSTLAANRVANPANDIAITLLRTLGVTTSDALLRVVARGSVEGGAVVQYDPSAGRLVLEAVIRDETLSVAERTIRIRTLLDLGVDAAGVLETLARESLIASSSEAARSTSAKRLELLIAQGACTSALFVNLGKRRARPIAQKMLAAGAPRAAIDDAITTLLANAEHNAAIMLALARDMANTVPDTSSPMLV